MTAQTESVAFWIRFAFYFLFSCYYCCHTKTWHNWLPSRGLGGCQHNTNLFNLILHVWPQPLTTENKLLVIKHVWHVLLFCFFISLFFFWKNNLLSSVNACVSVRVQLNVWKSVLPARLNNNNIHVCYTCCHSSFLIFLF